MSNDAKAISPVPQRIQPANIDRRRRRLIKGIAATVGAGAASGYLSSASAADGNQAEDDFSDIEHIIVVMMENRSFDHILGWVPGADGLQGDRLYTTDDGQEFMASELQDTQNFFAGDPDHTYGGARTHFNDGAMDGFLRTQLDQTNTFPIGYFGRDKVPFFSGCADYFTIGDRYFTGFMGPTWPNRIYMHSGQTDRMATGSPPADHVGLFCELPTIWDLAREAGVSASYYYSDAPMTAIWGTRLLSISRPFSDFLNDAAQGTLPAISFIDPAFIGEAIGLSNDDHPIADIRNGQAFLNNVYNALRLGPKWQNTLMIINYDEWGGFADHVAPPLAPVADSERNMLLGGNDGRLGFRVPLVLIGPRARRNAASTGGTSVVKEQYDPNAILNFICDRFGMPRLDVPRSETSGTLATALLPREQADYSEPPAFEVGTGTRFVLSQKRRTYTMDQALQAGLKSHFDDLRLLQKMAEESGYPLLGLRL